MVWVQASTSLVTPVPRRREARPETQVEEWWSSVLRLTRRAYAGGAAAVEAVPEKARAVGGTVDVDELEEALGEGVDHALCKLLPAQLALEEAEIGAL